MAEPAAKATAKPVSATKPAHAALRKCGPKTSVQPVALALVAVVAVASTAASTRKQSLAAVGGGSGADWEMF